MSAPEESNSPEFPIEQPPAPVVPSSGMTRRSFIKRTGAVAIVSVLAIGAFQTEAFASDDNGEYYIQLTMADDYNHSLDRYTSWFETHSIEVGGYGETPDPLMEGERATEQKVGKKAKAWKVTIRDFGQHKNESTNEVLAAPQPKDLKLSVSLSGNKLVMQGSGGELTAEEGMKMGANIVIEGNNSENGTATFNVRGAFTERSMSGLGVHINAGPVELQFTGSEAISHEIYTNLTYAFKVIKT